MQQALSFEMELDFDLNTAKDAVNTFVASTDVGCIIIDANGSLLYDAKTQDSRCLFCKRLQEITNAQISCGRSHFYGALQAERFGGKYIYFCPSGMVHFASPILVNGSIKAALIGGPLLIIEKEEYIIHDIMEKHSIPAKYEQEFKEHFAKTVVTPPERVSHLSNLLFMVAEHISGMEQMQLIEEQENYKQQGKINEYIQALKSKNNDTSSLPPYPLDKEKELLSSIEQGDKQNSQRLLNEILGHIFFSSGNKFDVIKARILELVVLLSRAAVEGGADVEQIFGLNYRYLNEINQFKTIEDLSFWLSKIMTRFTDFVFNFSDVKHMDVIYKSIDYIKRNYMKKITLEEVANHVYLSPSYFSKVFKDEMKCNFSTYLNKVRIEKSKKLLLSDNINLVDVSDLVGFEDQSYFSKVFKKLTGVTPGKFRESRGQIGKKIKL